MKIIKAVLREVVHDVIREQYDVDRNTATENMIQFVADPERAEDLWDIIDKELGEGVRTTFKNVQDKLKPFKASGHAREQDGRGENERYSVWYTIDYPTLVSRRVAFKLNVAKRWAAAWQSPNVQQLLINPGFAPDLIEPMLAAVQSTIEYHVEDAVTVNYNGIDDDEEEVIIDFADRHDLIDVSASAEYDGVPEEGPGPEIDWDMTPSATQVSFERQDTILIARLLQDVKVKIRQVTVPGDYDYRREKFSFNRK